MNTRLISSVVASATLACLSGPLYAQNPFNTKASEDAVPAPSIDDFGREFATQSTDEAVPTVYILPMYGQVGTDIHSSFYKELEEDIRSHDPDLLVIVMNCRDVEDLLIPSFNATEISMFDDTDYRNIVDFFHDSDHLGDIKQVMWVQDSLGSSSLVAMSWEKLYMMPGARLGGIRHVAAPYTQWQDEDIRAKMTAAITSYCKGFVEYGGYSPNIVDAMLLPEYMLSASFKGRDVDWTLDTAGEYVVDSSDERTVDFDASEAQDVLISRGTAETLDDLMLLYGYREYHVANSEAWPSPDNGGIESGEVAKYIEKWRRTYDKTKEWYRNFQRDRGRAGGDQTIQYLGKAKSSLVKIVKARNAFPAVDKRWNHDIGISKLDLETMIEQIQEEIVAARRAARGGGGGVGGGGAVGGGR